MIWSSKLSTGPKIQQKLVTYDIIDYIWNFLLQIFTDFHIS